MAGQVRAALGPGCRPADGLDRRRRSPRDDRAALSPPRLGRAILSKAGSHLRMPDGAIARPNPSSYPRCPGSRALLLAHRPACPVLRQFPLRQYSRQRRGRTQVCIAWGALQVGEDCLSEFAACERRSCRCHASSRAVSTRSITAALLAPLGSSRTAKCCKADKVLIGQAELDLLSGQFVRLDAFGGSATGQHVTEQPFALGKDPPQRSQLAGRDRQKRIANS